MNDNYLIALISYLLGAIPSGYLLLRIFHSKDIRSEGSGNVGAMNSYESSGSKFTGVLVFIMDISKAIAAVLIANEISSGDNYSLMISAVFCVLGHNYNVFLKFSGGRGLAPATGILLLLSPLGLFLWCLMYVSSYFVIAKNIHVASFAASITAPLLLTSMPVEFVEIGSSLVISDFTQFKIGYAMIGFLIVLRHAAPIKELIKGKENVFGSDGDDH